MGDPLWFDAHPSTGLPPTSLYSREVRADPRTGPAMASPVGAPKLRPPSAPPSGGQKQVNYFFSSGEAGKRLLDLWRFLQGVVLCASELFQGWSRCGACCCLSRNLILILRHKHSSAIANAHVCKLRTHRVKKRLPGANSWAGGGGLSFSDLRLPT